MHEFTLYLIANPLIGIGLGMLVFLCVYNILRPPVRARDA